MSSGRGKPDFQSGDVAGVLVLVMSEVFAAFDARLSRKITANRFVSVRVMVVNVFRPKEVGKLTGRSEPRKDEVKDK